MTRDEQVLIGSNELQVAILPALGARLHRLRVRGHELLRTPDRIDDHRREPFFWGGYPMAPWCNRVAPGPLVVAGRTIDVPPNFGDGTAIHGQVYDAPWRRVSESAFRIERGGDAWPWRYRVDQSFAISDATVRVAMLLTNLDDGPMPGGLGIHPWFPGHVEVVIDAQRALASNKDPLAELQQVEGDLDLRSGAPLEPGTDAAWTDLGDTPVELRWPEVDLRARLRAPAASWIVAAHAADLGAIAIEPQTHAPYGLSRLADGQRGGLTLIEPGDSLELVVELSFGP